MIVASVADGLIGTEKPWQKHQKEIALRHGRDVVPDPDSVHNEAVGDRDRLEAPALSDHDLTPEECMALARSAAERIDVGALARGGEGSYELLWRDEHSEAWLNTWWEPRDTGFHDHGGSCVGVYVLEGRATSEALVVGGGASRVHTYGAGESFSAPATGIHHVDHGRGAVTIHVYSPPLGEIGHYEVVDGELRRHAAPPDEVSPPSPGLSAALDRANERRSSQPLELREARGTSATSRSRGDSR